MEARLLGILAAAGAAVSAAAIHSACPDSNGDAQVDVDDLTAVILDWGTDGAAHGGDVDGSGLVDVDDLTAVILGWGPCPVVPGCLEVVNTEPEACGEDLNGGCGAEPPSFGSLVSGQTVNGTVWAHETERDTDWFTLTVGSSGAITVEVTAELPVMTVIIDDPNGNCYDIDIRAFGWSDDCVPTTTTATDLTPGTVAYVWFSTGSEGGGAIFDGYPCEPAGDGSHRNQYSATVLSD